MFRIKFIETFRIKVDAPDLFQRCYFKKKIKKNNKSFDKFLLTLTNFKFQKTNEKKKPDFTNFYLKH
jgi:hypothetical protein